MKPVRRLLLCCALSSLIVPATAQAAGPPVATKVPGISGTPNAGQTLRAITGTWSNAPTTYAYRWSACDAAGANCATVGTNSATLVLTTAHRGRRIRVAVTASNAYGSATSTSGATLAVNAPIASVAPVISGNPAGGYRLHATTGTFSNAPTSYAYRWQSCDSAVANCATVGANDADFVVTSAQVARRIRVTVTAANAYGSYASVSVATAAANSPMPAPPKTNEVLSTGGDHTCAVKADGTPVCWGSNMYGQTNVPTWIGRVTQISAGHDVTCAVKDSGNATFGTPVCWGPWEYGQTTIPAAVGTVRQVSVGDRHACAVKTNGMAICWGDDSWHQVTVPASVGPVTQVSAGGVHSCATRINGTVACWGDARSGGSVADLGGVTQVTSGPNHSCAIKTNGAPICWGYNDYGQASVPAGIGTITQISAGDLHTCAVKTNGTVACWGANSQVPATLGTVKQISAGYAVDTCAVKINGTAACWGSGTFGQTTVPAGLGTLAATTVTPAGPVIIGTLSSGQVLRTSPGVWINYPSYAYQWMSCDSAVANCKVIGTNSQSLTLTTAERGRRIRVTVIATNAFGSASRNSAATAVIAQ